MAKGPQSTLKLCQFNASNAGGMQRMLSWRSTVETHKMATPSHKLAIPSWLSSLLADGCNGLGKRGVANLGKIPNFP